MELQEQAQPVLELDLLLQQQIYQELLSQLEKLKKVILVKQ